MQRTDPAVRDAFADAGWLTRWHTRVRWAVAPMTRVERALPSRGSILEFGCGHGVFSIFAALKSPHRRIVGVDIDDRKVNVARAAAQHTGLPSDRLRFDVVTPGWVPSTKNRWDAIVIVDVLYLLGSTEANRLLDATVDAIAPGGRILVKEVDTTQSGRMAVLTAEERIMTRLGLTGGSVVEMIPIDSIEHRLRSGGLTTERSDLSRGFHAPHCLVVADLTPDHPTE